jgi:hypothetical protein
MRLSYSLVFRRVCPGLIELTRFQVLASVYLVAAETIVITVGDNAADGSTTFDPPRVDAVVGDTVVFNCKFFFFSCRWSLINIPVTSGNHTATQSTFSSPCIPAHDTNVTINGFDSGFRNTTPGTAGSILSVPILAQNQNETFWFFDFNTCGQGGVGAINNNESSTETLAGFVVRDFASCRINSATLRRFGVSHTHISHILRTNTHFDSPCFSAQCHPFERHECFGRQCWHCYQLSEAFVCHFFVFCSQEQLRCRTHICDWYRWSSPVVYCEPIRLEYFDKPSVLTVRPLWAFLLSQAIEVLFLHESRGGLIRVHACSILPLVLLFYFHTLRLDACLCFHMIGHRPACCHG